MSRKIYLAFLWHQHQPVYRETPVGQTPSEYTMPWVRLHATKDYYDMVAILDEFPKIKGNFNLVPSLLVQLEEYANGTATDKVLKMTLKPASELTPEDKVYILYNFFMANWGTMVEPYPRYRELLNKRGKYISFNELNRIQNYFREQELRDLQVWFNLAWIDPYWRWHDNFIADLFKKGKNFTEEEKIKLIEKQREICGKVVSKYKEAQEKGQIEVSVTPFYHPILPLIYNTEIAKISMPDVHLPRKFSKPEDAKLQIQKAIEYYEKIFGRKPQGMWPSEGSVSEDIAILISEAGINWIATDEDILFNTIRMQQSMTIKTPRQILYQPYKIEKTTQDGTTRSLNIIFRDRALSDSIGFMYARWNPDDAVNDFMSKLKQICSYFQPEKPHCFVPVILDGENCWEYYPNDGWDFLRKLYTEISNNPNIETVTISEYLKKFPPEITLRHLFPGSWINSNFGIWIGHPEDNLAWEYLNQTREFLENYIEKHPEKKESQEYKNAFEEMLIAEGSDWCWWYGEDHTSGQDDVFDYLFRKHLMNVYTILGEKIPDELYLAIKGKFKKKVTFYEPKDFIQPVIDGKVTNYFEWLSSGSYSAEISGSALHRTEKMIKEFYYGFDMNNLYFRIDIHENDFAIEDFLFNVLFLQPDNKKISIRLGQNIEFFLKDEKGEKDLKTGAFGCQVAFKKILEFSVPFDLLEIKINDPIEFVITVEKIIQNKETSVSYEIERWPYQDSIKLVRPTEEFSAKSWT